MLEVATVTNDDELIQIHELSKRNLKEHLTLQERNEQGFVTWLYSIDLLQKMHELAPSIIIKENN